MADLRGKVALLTGACCGVGPGIAEGLAEAGATIYLQDVRGRDPAALAAVVDALGGAATALVVDPTDAEQVKALLARIEGEHGRLDLLVNNAYPEPDGAEGSDGFWERDATVWDESGGAGLKAYYVASSHAAAMMVRRRNGLIVNVSADPAMTTSFGVSWGVGLCAVDRMAREMASALEGHNVAALSLWPAAGGGLGAGRSPREVAVDPSPRFTGRCVAALAMDPDVMDKTGGVYLVTDLAEEYRFTDTGGASHDRA